MKTKTKAKPAPEPKPRPAKQPPTLPPGTDALLSKAQVGFAIGVSVRTLEGMIHAGEFPAPETRVGAFPRWRVQTLNAWIAGRCEPKGA